MAPRRATVSPRSAAAGRGRAADRDRLPGAVGRASASPGASCWSTRPSAAPRSAPVSPPATPPRSPRNRRDRAARYARLKLAGLDDAPCQLAVFADPETGQGHGLGRLTMPEMIAYSAVAAVHTLWLAARAEGIGMGWVSILDPAGGRRHPRRAGGLAADRLFLPRLPCRGGRCARARTRGLGGTAAGRRFYGEAMSEQGKIRVGIGGWVFLQ